MLKPPIKKMVTKVLKGLIGRTIKAHMDDMLVKNLSFEQHLKDLKVVFVVLRKYKMKFNPAKCIFGMKAGKFLGL